MIWFDSHTHLDAEKFNDDREEVIARALEKGVHFMMNPGADLSSSKAAVELAATHEGIYAAVGVHPHDTDTMTDEVLAEIESLAAHDKVMAIGEIGLDYFYEFSKKESQKVWFRKQLQLAKKLNLPVIIHDRDAHGDVMDILTEEDSFATGVLLHCYSGSKELAQEYVKKGALISIAGPVTFKNARKTVEVVETIPLDKLLIETDSPYLTPVPNRGKRNESGYVPYVGQRIADIKAIDVEEVARVTMDNTFRFFKILR